MEVIKAVPDGIRAVVFTVDETLHHCGAYLEEGRRRVIEELARPFALSADKVEGIIAQRKADLEKAKKREVTFLEVITTLSIADLQWRSMCDRSHRPEAYFQRERELRHQLQRHLGILYPRKLIAAGMLTRGLSARTLGSLGLNTGPFFSGRIWSPEQGGNPVEEHFWTSLAVHFGFAPSTIVVVGSSRITDVQGPLAAGYGGVVFVEGPHELEEAITLLRRERRGGES